MAQSSFFTTAFRSVYNWMGGRGYSRTPEPHIYLSYLGKNANMEVIQGREEYLYRTTPELFAVINKKADLFCNGRFKHYRIGRDGKPEVIENSPVVDRLENPNVLQSRDEFLRQEMIQQSLFGNTYTFSLRGSRASESPSALWNLSPDRMTVYRTGLIWMQTDPRKIIERYQFTNDGAADPTNFEPKDIFHNRMPNPCDPVLGISPLEALQQPISNIRLAYQFRNVIMDQHGMLGIISGDAKDSIGQIDISPEQKMEIEKQYSRTHGIHKGQSRVKISSTSVKYQPTAFPTRDLLLFEEVTADKLAIIDGYGLNQNVFSNEKGSTYANAEEGKKSAYQDSIIPYAEKYCFGLSRLLGLIEKTEWIELDYSHVECLRDDEVKSSQSIERRARAYSALAATENFTPAQLQELFGFTI